MIVEDDPMIMDMYAHKFEQEGFRVVTHDRGDGVVELAASEQPKIILLDIIMPGLDGFSVLKQLKQASGTKDIKVVMLTNLGQDEDRIKGTELGAIGYVVKSSRTPGEVVKLVNEFLAQE